MPNTLAQWLARIEGLHPSAIDLGLERVARVRDRMGLAPTFPIITVAGTNGKGSTCAMLEAVLAAAGYTVGCYTSPHLLRYNERVRVNRCEAQDPALCRAFAAVEQARGDVPLTYFEFGTLAALWHFIQAGVQAAVLEVGLGGRLDAVNAFDADCAVITSIDLDHVDYLGATREAIGREKAGIFRCARPAICAEPEVPATVESYAQEVGARLYRIGRDFGPEAEAAQWRYRGPRGSRYGLPYPALRGAFQLNNGAACLAALDELRERLPVTAADVRRGLLDALPAGRFQVLPGTPSVVLDVAHNPHAAAALASNLAAMPCSGDTIAVFAMLADKDVAGVVQATKRHIGRWLLADIREPRGAKAGELLQTLRAQGAGEGAELFPSVDDAYRRACILAKENDRIIVFGSFYTVAAVLRQPRGGEGQSQAV